MKFTKKITIILLAIAMISTMVIGCESNENTANNVENNTMNDTNDTANNTVEEVTEEVVEITFADDSYLVSADYLLENLNNEEILLLDARGEEAYSKGHIPGAIAISWPGFANVDGAPGDAGWGVVLAQEVLSERLSAVGVDNTKTIIVYADTQNGWGEDGRIVWMLRMAGIENSKMLDGGFNFWDANDYETTKEATVVTASTFTVEAINEMATIGTEELTERMEELTIIDTREQNEFDGDTKYGEKRGGHLPGSILLTFNAVLNEDGTMKTAAELDEIFTTAGLNKKDEIVTYCTAGIRSAHLQVALNMMGYNNVRNYDASFYEYAADDTLPLESN